MRLAISTGVTLVLALWIGAAQAQPADADLATARALGEQGVAALEKKDYAAAADLFGRADALLHVPTLTLGLARSQAGLGKLVAAHETYNRIVREGAPSGASPAFLRAVEDARTEVEAIRARLPSVTITVSGPSVAIVTLDGASVPRAALGVRRFVDPGKHTVHASADGFLAKDVTFEVAEAGSAEAALVLPPDPAAPPVGGAGGQGPASTPEVGPPQVEPPPQARDVGASGGSVQWILGFGAIGFGVGGLATGATAGAVALSYDADLQEVCPAGVCSPDAQTKIDAYSRMSVLSTVSLVVGGVGLGVGTTLILAAPGDEGSMTPQGAGGWSLIGFGGAALIEGAVTLALATTVDSELADTCASGGCPSGQQGNIDNLAVLQPLAIVGFAAGAASVGLGAALVATAPEPPSSTQSSANGGVSLLPYVGPTSVGVVGRF